MFRRLPNYNPAEHMPTLEDLLMTRRDMLQRTGMGMGALSLAMLLGQGSNASAITAAASRFGEPAFTQESAASLQGQACDPHFRRRRAFAR